MASTDESVSQVLRDYIAEEFASGDPNQIPHDDESLVESGIIDSLGIFLVIGFIEERFGVQVALEDIVLENFETVNAITNLVAERLSSVAAR